MPIEFIYEKVISMFIQTYSKEIVALVVPFIAWVLNTILKPKARLVIAQPHAFTFLVQEPLVDKEGKTLSPTQIINTRSFHLSNVGRESATKIEMVFNWKPFCVNLWPARHYEEKIAPDNRYTLLIGSLAPGESLGFEVFSINGELPILLIARSEQSVATHIDMVPQPVTPLWVAHSKSFLNMAGLAALVYVALASIQYLVS